MPEINTQQKRKIEKLLDLSKKGNVAILKYLFELEEKLETEIPETIEREISQLKETMEKTHEMGMEAHAKALDLVEKFADIERLKGERGEDGVSPSVQEVAKEAAKYVKQGKDGRDGVDGKTPIKGVDYFDGVSPDPATIVLEASKLTVDTVTPLIPTVEAIEKDLPKLGEPIRDALELLEGENRLRASAIQGLEELLNKLRGEVKTIGTISSRAADRIKIDDLSGSTNGSDKTFYLEKAPLDTKKVLIWCTDFPTILRPDVDFTIANKLLTLTDEVSAPTQGATLIVQYTI